jgi:alpha-galactosidase
MPGIYPSLARIVTLSRHVCGDIELHYRHDEATGQVGLSLVPAALASRVVARRGTMDDDFQVRRLTWRHAPWLLDSLVQVKLSGSANPAGLSAGGTLLHSPDTLGLVLAGQHVEPTDGGFTVVTRLHAGDGRHACEHRAAWRRDESGIRMCTTFFNLSAEVLRLESLASFLLGDITPFDGVEATERLRVHRYRSWWGAEARRETRSLEDLHLERAWGTGPVRTERFGQVGSLPVRGFFPFVAVEDHVAGVVWAAQVEAPGSWQLEISRRGDSLSISGGLADRLFGHWARDVPPGANFHSGEAFVTCVHGAVDEACQRLTGMHRRARLAQPAAEQALPPVFNDWCSSWGQPTHDSVLALADRLRGSGVRYLVMDAGWYADPGAPWGDLHGDWNVSKVRFPLGLRALCDAVRARGLVPGIWFEFETCGILADCHSREDLLLHLDGAPLTSGARRFLDFRQPAVLELLARRVIALLRENGIGYLKVDYNESIGLGADGAESPGEGLRAHLEGVLGFFRRLRTELPDLVIENCSSGGHRLEPAFMQLCAMGSFSDAHEGPEVPVIAANLHNLILPEQNLVWAVLRADDDADRLSYSLAAGLLGRLCLSGDLLALDERQRAMVDAAIAFQARAAGVLARGRSTLHDAHRSASWRDLRGWQALTRVAEDGGAALVVIHRFAASGAGAARVPLPPGRWRVAHALGAEAARATVDEVGLADAARRDWTGAAWLLERVP